MFWRISDFNKICNFRSKSSNLTWYKTSFENYKKNLYNNYNKHLIKIPEYISTLGKAKIIDENSKITISFFIENSSKMGSYLYIEEKLKPFIPFTADFFIKILEENAEKPDFIIYAQETKDDVIVAIMSTKYLAVYKQNFFKVMNENFISFSPYVIQKRFFIEGEKKK